VKKSIVLIIMILLAGSLIYILTNKESIFKKSEEIISKEVIESPEKMEFEGEKTKPEEIKIEEMKPEEIKSEKNIEEKIEKLYPASLKVIVNKKVIEADNVDKVKFSVEVYDQKGNKIDIENKEELEIYVNNDKISEKTFTTNEKGEYSVFVKYKNLYSPQVGFIAQKTNYLKIKILKKR